MENLNKTLVKNDNPTFSYRNNENYEIHHRRFSNKHVELVYTKYEVKRSIIKEGGCIQPFRAQNPVFDTLTPVTVRISNSCGDPTDRKIRERKSLSDGFSLISCPPEYAEVGPLMSL